MRLKGYVYNFSPVNPRLHLFDNEVSLSDKSIEVSLKDLKAIFFVKDFAGDPEHNESAPGKSAAAGRKIEVILSDGETLQGTTQGYDPKRLGFFLYPSDQQSNNLRIFVVNQNVRQVKWV